MKKIISIFFSIISSMVSMAWVYAEPGENSELSYLQDFPVVLSASRLYQPLAEAPSAMTVIDKETIKASGFRRIPDLFKLVPGMYVSYNTANEPIVAFHGSTDNLARRMQVLVDGRSVFMPPIGSVLWESLPLQMDDIERIEVIRGPAAATHGGNSTQGVINIITREAGVSPGFRVSVTQGNAGIADASMSYDQSAESLDYRISLAHRGDYGYDSYNRVTTGALVENNDSYISNLFNLRGNFHPNASDRFDFQLGLNEGSLYTGGANDPNAPHYKKHHDEFEQLGWTRALSNGDELQLKLYHIYQNQINTLPPISPYPALDDGFTNSRDNVELQHTLHTSSSNRLVWGTSWRSDWSRAPARFLEGQSTQQTTFFAHDEWRINPQWLLNIGAMQEDSGLGQRHISPRTALIYKVAENQAVRAGISQAYRNPSVYEERGNYHFPAPINTLYAASGGLRSENALTRELGYLGEFKELGFSLDARVYNERISDIIYETENYPKDFANLFDVEHNGIEISTRHHWGNNHRLLFNYAYQVFSSNTDLSYASPYNESMPRNMVSALYSKSYAEAVSLSLGYYMQSMMLPIDRTEKDKQPYTTRWDMRIAKGFKRFSGSAEGEIALVVQGLLNEHYNDYVDTNIFNRRVFLTGSLRY